MEDIKSMEYDRLQTVLTDMGEKRFRAGQLYDWMHRKLAADYGEMTDLPLSLRSRLERDYPLTVLQTVQVQTSRADGTQKFLFSLGDGELTESVLMRYRHGLSVCISSQVGCRMGCRFCASTLDGKKRDLRPSEMLEQVYGISRIVKERVSHVVVMGTGEPLDNYDNLLVFLRLLTGEKGLHISQRNVTVSTCGIVPGIYALAKENLQITLALSLHAPTDEKRRQIMPVANRYGIGELTEACRAYYAATGRRITWEYSLIGGFNDTPQDADALAALARPLSCHINLIPVNPIQERNYAPSSRAVVEAFKNRLEKNKINVTIRREMGRDIDGACGQLRRRQMQRDAKG